MFRKAHLILGKDLDEQLIETVNCFNFSDLKDFLSVENIKMSSKMNRELERKNNVPFNWEGLLDKTNLKTFDANGLHLMKKLMHLNPNERITVDEALNHSFLN
jgi:hypothetical protein